MLRYIEHKYNHLEKLEDKKLEVIANLLTLDLKDDRELSDSAFNVKKPSRKFNSQ